MGKPHDDFCGLLPINVYPQVKMGNNLLENLEEKRNRPRLEGSLSFNMRFSGMLEPPGLWRELAASRLCTRQGTTARAFYELAVASLRMTSL